MAEQRAGVEHRDADARGAGGDVPRGRRVDARRRIEQIPLVRERASGKGQPANAVARIVGRELDLVDVVRLREVDVGLGRNARRHPLDVGNGRALHQLQHRCAVVHVAAKRERRARERREAVDLQLVGRNAG